MHFRLKRRGVAPTAKTLTHAISAGTLRHFDIQRWKAECLHTETLLRRLQSTTTQLATEARTLCRLPPCGERRRTAEPKGMALLHRRRFTIRKPVLQRVTIVTPTTRYPEHRGSGIFLPQKTFMRYPLIYVVTFIAKLAGSFIVVWMVPKRCQKLLEMFYLHEQLVF